MGPPCGPNTVHTSGASTKLDPATPPLPRKAPKSGALAVSEKRAQRLQCLLQSRQQHKKLSGEST